MINNIYKNAGNVNYKPYKPVISRFVSPWDTSGWYSVLPNFSAGCCVYSNTEVKVASCPDETVGCDYIMTFNSFAEGFDDKQEVDFFVEQESYVYVCLDSRLGVLPDFIKDFENISGTIALTDGQVMKVFRKVYHSSEHVHIPGIRGNCSHFIVLAKACEPSFEQETLIGIPATEASLPKSKKKTYTYYINEVFNTPESIHHFGTTGNVVFGSESVSKDCYAVIDGHGSMYSKIFGNDVIQTVTVIPEGKKGKYRICEFMDNGGNVICSFQIEGGKIIASTNMASKELGPVEYSKELHLTIEYNSGAQHSRFFLNSVDTQVCLKAKGKIDTIGIEAHDGRIKIDDIKVYDNTENYIVNKSGKNLKINDFQCSANTELKPSPIPFKKKPSVSMVTVNGEDAYAVYPFSAVSGTGSVEVKVRTSNRNLSKISLTSDKGEICAAALYMNNLYISDSSTWKQIYAGLTDWMYYPCKNFCIVKITFNTETGMFDVWVDGAKRACQFHMNNTEPVNAVAFTVSADTELLLEKIKVYDCADFSRDLLPCGKIYNVCEAPYNAKGDGIHPDTRAIQQALDDAAFTGGTVFLPGGTYLCGELFLRSDETLFASSGATVIGSQDHSLYPLQEPGTSLCAHRQLGRGLIYGEDVKNVTITGGGMLDGNGRYRFKMNDPAADRRKQDARPDIIYIAYSRNIEIKDINFKSSAFWTVVPLSSGNITIRNLNLDCMNTPNRDGIDPVDCHDITVSGCCIMAGDDGLCFKSSDPLGCYHIDVHDMMIQSLASGIKFGTDTYYCLTDAKFSDCTVKNVQRCGVSLESVDGALVKDVTFERIDMTDVSAPVYVSVGVRNRLPRGVSTVRTSKMDNIVFKDIRFEDAYPFSYTKDIRESIVCGQSNNQRIDHITFDGIYWELEGGDKNMHGPLDTIDNRYPEYDRHGLSGGYAFAFRFCSHIKIKRQTIILKNPDVRPMARFDDCK